MSADLWAQITEWSPEHAEEVEAAVENLQVALNSMVITGASEMMHHGAIEWCVDRLREEIRSDIEMALKYETIEPPEEPS